MARSVADLAPTGKLRVSIFLPQYTKHPATGKLRGIGMGFVAIEIGRALPAKAGRSPALIRGILISLSGILGEAFDSALVAQNVVRSRKRKRRTNGERKMLQPASTFPRAPKS